MGCRPGFGFNIPGVMKCTPNAPISKEMKSNLNQCPEGFGFNTENAKKCTANDPISKDDTTIPATEADDAPKYYDPSEVCARGWSMTYTGCEKDWVAKVAKVAE